MSLLSRRSLSGKLMQLVLATTAVALLLSATALLFYEITMYRQGWVNDLTTQADIIGQTSRAALAFDDPQAASETLHMLRLRPDIVTAAVHRSDGSLFATYQRPEGTAPVALALPSLPGYRFTAREVALWQPIIDEQGRTAGFVSLQSLHDLTSRVVDYLLILATVMVASLVIALMVSIYLQRTVTGPVVAVASLARQIMEERNFGLRAAKVSDDEVGELVDAFNGMLHEVDTQTSALAASNQHLRIEMAERRRAEEALKEASRTKDAFLATLAHELRNPLAPISTASEILKRLDDGSVPARRNAIDMLGRQLQQMVRLIDDLLDVSRISTGKLLLKISPVDLIAVLHSAEEIAAPLIQRRTHTLQRDYPSPPLYVEGDAVRLAQVFANLLTNAAKYTPPGGQIAVHVASGDEWATVSVRDNGMGIPQHLQSAIFDLFVQLDQSLERNNSGLGLGLTLTRQLVELHGGQIEVHSDGAGCGATFTVKLPLKQTPSSALMVPAVDLPEAAIDAPLRVLVADDNIDFVNSLATLLEAHGHQVMRAYNGRQAYEAACVAPPDVAFLDIGMPELNGYQLATRLRGHAATRHTVLVAVTGWGQPEDRERAQQAGVHHLLVKPVQWEQIAPLLTLRRSSA